MLTDYTTTGHSFRHAITVYFPRSFCQLKGLLYKVILRGLLSPIYLCGNLRFGIVQKEPSKAKLDPEQPT